MHNELRPFWNRIFNFDWKFGLFLILIVCIPRFILVLNANATQNYRYIALVMVISAIVPFIFLKKNGRKRIGITRPIKYKWLLMAFISGLTFSILLYFLGQALYGNSAENWYYYIGKSYNIPEQINQHDKTILFIITAVSGMIFSPVGEEFYFRGIVHASFSNSVGEKQASIVDSSSFALTHVSHFGLVFINNQFKFLLVPALIWILSMFLVSMVFIISKRRSGSLFGSIICHAAFNLGMIFCIFYLI